MTGSTIWDQILSRIETKVNRHIFYTWFKPATFVADAGGTLRIRVPNALFRDWLTKHYAAVLEEALTEIGRSGSSIAFLTEDEPAAAPPRPAVDTTVPDRPPMAATEVTDEPEDDIAEAIPGSLAPRYSFDTFIVGSSNQFAHAACRAVAEAPSRSYNPLFIYGGVGLGKTHLMHAIGHYVLNHLKTLKLTYISSERFMNEMING
ncbi:MAG: DnaA/Hda family protein, partial [Acidobacteriota bacterium]